MSSLPKPNYHLTELRISKSALKHNLEYFSGHLKKDTGIMLMVKAAAYGHDAELLAKSIAGEERIKYLAVAYADEGIRLREVGIELPILVLNPSKNSFTALQEYCLEPEIHNFDLLKSFSEFLAGSASESPHPIHLKFNTGMNRMGFDLDEIEQLLDFLREAKLISIRSIMTHLSSSNLADEDEFTLAQLAKFQSIIAQTKSIQEDKTFFHCLNSNGIVRFPEHQYDLVRLGIGFYGTSTVPEIRENLIPATTFCSRISQIRKVKKGDSISYSRSGRAPKDTRIASLAIGYADGFNRMMGNGRWEVEINGKLYPTIGNICMDISMIDLGDDEIETDAEVIIFGGKKSIYHYADTLGTITYEVMCNVGNRVKRVLIP